MRFSRSLLGLRRAHSANGPQTSSSFIKADPIFGSGFPNMDMRPLAVLDDIHENPENE